MLPILSSQYSYNSCPVFVKGMVVGLNVSIENCKPKVGDTLVDRPLEIDDLVEAFTARVHIF
jgi:hypothetical protein